MKRDFISLRDYSSQELVELLHLAQKLKHDAGFVADCLRGKTFALIFQKPSNRTRVSFETGIFQLGGKSIYLAPEDISLGKREPTADIARTLSRYVNGIIARVFAHQDLLDLSRFASVPVINALSDLSHPCQSMADMLTILEHFSSFKGLKIAYVGDGNNMTNSLMLAAAKLGVSVSVASPEGYDPDSEYMALSKAAALKSGASLQLTRDPRVAVKGAQVVYTDTWVSMGQETETEKRLKDFAGFQVNKELMALADTKAVFMHCLPAHRGQEVSADVIDGSQSIVFDEAENRLHIQKAIMISLYTFKN